MNSVDLPHLNRVEEVQLAGTNGTGRVQQHPQHPAQLLHVMELEHFQLLLERVLPHHHVHKLLLAVGAHGQCLLDKMKTLENSVK